MIEEFRILRHISAKKALGQSIRQWIRIRQTVRKIIEMVQYRKTNYVVKAYIKCFFDNINRDWLIKMLSHDIVDRRFLAIVEKSLKAGVMGNGKY